jgi:hypothetical protein
VRAGGLDRGGPRREGVEPSSEAVLAEVALSPRARRTPPEGALGPRARRTSPEGASRPRTRRTPPVGVSNPRARRIPPEEAFVVPPRRAAGATRVVIVSHVCFRFVS